MTDGGVRRLIIPGDISSGAVTSGRLGSGAVLPGNVASGAIQSGNLGAGAVLPGNVASGAVDRSEVIAPDIVDWSKIKGVAGFVSSADTCLILAHNLGAVPTVYLITPYTDANYYVSAVTASTFEVTTTTSGSGALLTVIA